MMKLFDKIEPVFNIDDEKFQQYLGNYDYFKERKIKKLVPHKNISHDRRK